MYLRAYISTIQQATPMSTLIRLKTDEVFATCYHKSGGESSYYVSENALVYVAAGKLEVRIDGEGVASFVKGECVFVRKDHRMTLVNNAEDGIDYHLSVFLFFPRQYLFDYYKTLHKWDLPKRVSRSDRSFLSIPRSSLLTSLFESFKPYWVKGENPEKHWLKIKVIEAIRLLLLLDESVYASLFDFTSQWRLDIMDFMEKNYKYDLTVSDLARYTGRSVATFKRDFSKLSELSPANWIICRRLREAHRLLLLTDWSVYKVMTNVGFKNFSHFSRRYREFFGETPTQTRQGSGKSED